MTTYNYINWNDLPSSETIDDNDTILFNGTNLITITNLYDQIVDLFPLKISERSSDPDDPAEGQSAIWQSDGTGLGADGDLAVKITSASNTLDYGFKLYLYPSNDETGVTDTANIKNAVTRAIANNTLYDALPSIILGEGRFYINDTIDMAGDTTFSNPPVRLIGSESTSIRWVGDAPGAGEQAPYMFRWTPKHERRNRTSLMVDILLDCQDKARGALFSYCWYYTPMERCYILSSRQTGFDAIQCWGSTIVDSTVSAARGFCCRTDQFNNAKTVGLQLVGRGDSDLSDDEWPAVNDTTTLSYPSGVFQVPSGERCAWHHTGRGGLFLTSSFEGSNYGDKPALFVGSGVSDASSRNIWDGIWWESTSFSSHRIYLDSRPGTLYANAFNHNDGNPTTDTDSFIKVYGSSKGITVNDSLIGKINNYLVESIYGTHTDITVERTRTIDNATSLEISRENLVGGTHVTALKDDVTYHPTPTEIADGNTAITTDDIRAKLLYMESSDSPRFPTVPTGATLYYFMNYVGASLEWSFVNTGSKSITISPSTGHTLVGSMVLAPGDSGKFLTRITAANTAITYRLSASTSEEYIVRPSGKTDGTDTTNINNACGALFGIGGTVTLMPGAYYITGTIYVTTGVTLRASSRYSATLNVPNAVTPNSSVFAIDCSGTLENIYLNCNDRFSGVILTNVRNSQKAISNMYVYKSIGVGIFALSCYTSTFENIILQSCSGIGIGATDVNATVWNTIRFIACTFNDTSKYGFSISKIVANVDNVKIINFSTENCNFGSNPAIQLVDVNNIEFDGVRSESDTLGSYYASMTSSSSAVGNNIKFRRVTAGASDEFLNCATHSEVTIDGLVGAPSGNIIVLNGGTTHITPMITGVKSSLISPSGYIGLEGGAATVPRDMSTVMMPGIRLRELSADPTDPTEGQSIIWQSDGTGAGDDGDIMMKITAGGTTKTVTLVDFSVV